MNIARYIKEHERFIKEQLLALNEETDWQLLKENHQRVTVEMQHERLVHLLVTLAFGAFLLITMGIALVRPSILVYILLGLFFVMLIPYITHYFFLENTIQRWYELTDEIGKKGMKR